MNNAHAGECLLEVWTTAGSKPMVYPIQAVELTRVVPQVSVPSVIRGRRVTSTGGGPGRGLVGWPTGEPGRGRR